MARIYTLVNQKGGVGKTTSAINLGAYLGYFGQRVLLVDLDPQANATSSLGVNKNSGHPGTYEVLIGQAPVTPQILHNAHLKISLLPSSPALAGAEIELVDVPHREQRLREVLNPLKDRYDYILIDCPPSLGLLTVNGLVSAQHGVIIPVQCEYLALEGLGQLTQTITRVRAGLFPELEVRGVILTMYDGRNNLSRQVAEEIRTHFKGQAFQTVVPRNVRLSEAPSHGKPIILYDITSRGAVSYLELARELMERCAHG